MGNDQHRGLTDAELAAEDATALPDKEVVSILDLNADLDLAIDAAAPIDLGVAANANVAAPIDAAVGANILSTGSEAQALSDQGVMINQGIDADATATANQDSTLEQGAAPAADATTTPSTDATAPAADATTAAPTAAGGGTALPDTGLPTDGLPTDGLPTDGAALPGDVAGTVDDAAGQVGNLTDGNLLNVNVDLNGDANIAAPINGAVAANANVAAPIDAALAANIGSVDSSAVAVSQQDAIINQDITGSAEATADQGSTIQQP